MAAYLVANYTITNPEGYKAYPPAVTPTLAAHGAEILAVDHDSDVIEGQAGNITVILKFPSKEALRNWYYSEEYQGAIKSRTDNSEGLLVFADEFIMPG